MISNHHDNNGSWEPHNSPLINSKFLVGKVSQRVFLSAKHHMCKIKSLLNKQNFVSLLNPVAVEYSFWCIIWFANLIVCVCCTMMSSYSQYLLWQMISGAKIIKYSSIPLWRLIILTLVFCLYKTQDVHNWTQQKQSFVCYMGP